MEETRGKEGRNGRRKNEGMEEGRRKEYRDIKAVAGER